MKNGNLHIISNHYDIDNDKWKLLTIPWYPQAVHQALWSDQGFCSPQYLSKKGFSLLFHIIVIDMPNICRHNCFMSSNMSSNSSFSWMVLMSESHGIRVLKRESKSMSSVIWGGPYFFGLHFLRSFLFEKLSSLSSRPSLDRGRVKTV